jgi:hypothetical protein
MLMILLLLVPPRLLWIMWFIPFRPLFLSRTLVDWSIFLALRLPISQGMILTQHKYALDLLHRANMENRRAVTTPMSSTDKLSRDDGDPLALMMFFGTGV